ncbi:uncharacterized protein METZ01_LOCUS226040 [marine metagenome]|uniref:Uncharacterized protein n=1 Tax=marine metagenome TaxID=408172 RepID=A0A382GD68_9ZZZZ
MFLLGAIIPHTDLGGDWCVVGEENGCLFVELDFGFVCAYSF